MSFFDHPQGPRFSLLADDKDAEEVLNCIMPMEWGYDEFVCLLEAAVNKAGSNTAFVP